jgi:DNA-binding transcriptional regulator YiaG
MPNIASVLREEISRLARKEIRQQVGPLKKTSADLRRTVTALKSEVTALRRGVRFLEKQEKRRLQAAPKASAAKGVRFAAQWVKADRERLSLSASDYGLLVGVSGQTIYNWENGKSKPQTKQLAAWASVRRIGKREALRRLELLG